jgi:hypothetical protein
LAQEEEASRRSSWQREGERERKRARRGKRLMVMAMVTIYDNEREIETGRMYLNDGAAVLETPVDEEGVA